MRVSRDFGQKSAALFRCWANAKPTALNEAARFFSVDSQIPFKTTRQIRSLFLDYFAQKHNHRIISSASLIPQRDPSLLFTSAGMVPLKDYFLGQSVPPHPYLTSAQLCLRAGGKHNDLDNVGRTARHHTLFEMLGNFSFAGDSDYKEKAMKQAWEFITIHLKLPKERLRVSVYEGSKSDAEIWKSVAGLSSEQIVFRGAEDNYWQMGDVGPCGPCTEIFFDQGKEVDGDRWLEIWNLVFMEHFRDASGKTNLLNRPCIDTGMGLERIAAVVQGVSSNFDIDSFQSIIQGIRNYAEKKTGNPIEYLRDSNTNETVTLKVLADHLRAVSCLIVEGIIPSNVGRGYVLRRLIRRSLTFGWTIGLRDPFLHELVPTLFTGDDFDGTKWNVHPLLSQEASFIQSIIKGEEILFHKTLSNGIKILDESLKSSVSDNVLDPEVGFKLYDTYGFPIDMTAILAERKGVSLDLKKVEALMDKQREESRKNWKGSEIKDGTDLGKYQSDTKTIFRNWQQSGIQTQFTGYESLSERNSTIMAVERVNETDYAVAISPCPFYATGGGQVADRGFIHHNGHSLEVIDVAKPYNNVTVCIIRDPESNAGIFVNAKVGDRVEASVDEFYRDGVSAHHTATHLLHSALRKVLGDGVRQSGSIVEQDRLRFDFSYPSPLTREQIQQVEELVSAECRKSIHVKNFETSYKEATEGPVKAIGLFGEKYEDKVRVVQVGNFSTELCGGTHVKSTSSIVPFKITEETSIATGTRRIQAHAGVAAERILNKHYEAVSKCASMLGTSMSSVPEQVESLSSKLRENEKELGLMKKKLMEMQIQSSLQTTDVQYKGITLQIHKLPLLTNDDKEFMGAIREHAEKASKTLPSTPIIVVGGTNVAVCVSDEASKQIGADFLLKEMTAAIGGRGGGRKTFAQGKIQPTQSPSESKGESSDSKSSADVFARIVNLFASK